MLAVMQFSTKMIEINGWIRTPENKNTASLPGEVWKPIMGYEDLYKISNYGRVIGLERRTPVFKNRWGVEMSRIVGSSIRNSNSDERGYYRVQLSKNGINKLYSIHRLIALHFIPNPENKPFINHINAIPSDNRISNLEWCTQSENIKHAFEIGTKTPCMHMLGKMGELCQNSKAINQYDLSGNFIKKYGSLKMAAQDNGTYYRKITEAIRDYDGVFNGLKYKYA